MAQQTSAAEALMSQQDCTQGRFLSWNEMNSAYFPLMRAVRDALNVQLENRCEKAGPTMSQIGGIEIGVVFKRGMNRPVEKCSMTFNNKYCVSQGYEYLHEGNLIF